MILCEVERGEDVPVILDLGTLGDREAEAGEDLRDLLLDERQRVARTEGRGVGAT